MKKKLLEIFGFGHSEIPAGAQSETSGGVMVGSTSGMLQRADTGEFEVAQVGVEYRNDNQHGNLFGTVYIKYLSVPDIPGLGALITIPLGVTPTGLFGVVGWAIEHTTGKLFPIPNGSGATTDPRSIAVAIDGSNLILDANDNLDWDSGYVWIMYTR